MTESITIIGAGNVAWHLAPALQQAGHAIDAIYSRSIDNARLLCDRLEGAQPVCSLDFCRSRSTLFIISVSDDAIETVASRLVLPSEAMLVHTSGTAPMSRLAVSGIDNIGVFYPLQTFSKSRNISFQGLPLLIEAGNETTQNRLLHIARSLTENVSLTSSEDRKGIHLAAVFANNFSNHMIDIAGRIMRHEGLDENLLKPLIRETVEKALVQSPSSAQTGPAIRGDTKTMQKHIDQLDFNPVLQQIYRLVSESIANKS